MVEAPSHRTRRCRGVSSWSTATRPAMAGGPRDRAGRHRRRRAPRAEALTVAAASTAPAARTAITLAEPPLGSYAARSTPSSTATWRRQRTARPCQQILGDGNATHPLPDASRCSSRAADLRPGRQPARGRLDARRARRRRRVDRAGLAVRRRSRRARRLRHARPSRTAPSSSASATARTGRSCRPGRTTSARPTARASARPAMSRR